MNLRDIKKDIEYVLSAFVEDCSIVAAVNAKASEKEVSKLMEEAINLYNELRDKVNSKIDGSKKTYFANLRKEILTKTDALYEKLSSAVKNAAEAAPADEKPAAKKPAATKKPVAEKKAPAEKKPAAAKKTAAAKETTEKKAPAAKKPAAKKAPAKKAE